MSPTEKTVIAAPPRYELEETRISLTHRRIVCGYKLYVTVSFFNESTTPDRPAEVFTIIAKQGSMVAGAVDSVCSQASIALQHGIPWEVVSKPMRHHVFERREDLEHTSVIDGIACIVDKLIVERREQIGIPGSDDC